MTQTHSPSPWQRVPGWIARLAQVGVTPDDSEELRLRKGVLTLSATLNATVACAWVVTYGALGLWLPAVIPLGYQVATAVGLVLFARAGRYRLLRGSQLWMGLLLPFALQWSLGGFTTGSAVCLWGFTGPLGALLFIGARQSLPWFGGFAVLVAVSVAIDPTLQAAGPDVPYGVIVAFLALNVIGVTASAYVLLGYFVRAREESLRALAAEHRALEQEQVKSERLLLNVLPAPVAARLKEREGIIAEASNDVTVLFADIVGFTTISQRMPASDLVAVLDRVFAAWDGLAIEHGVEKIKTIGDAYMAAAGIPLPRADHAEAIAALALAMRPAAQRCARESGVPLEVRIGIDSGPVVAGVIGRSKFIYDLWGDTVNTASRMESYAEPGTIQTTARAYDRLRDAFDLHERGTIDVKGKGPMRVYVLDPTGGARLEGATSG